MKVAWHFSAWIVRHEIRPVGYGVIEWRRFRALRCEETYGQPNHTVPLGRILLWTYSWH